MDWNMIAALAAVLTALIGAQWKFFSSLDRRFSDLKAIIFKVKDELLEKIEYHEKHDDSRFGQINDSIWLLRLRNAAKDGIINGTDQWSEAKNSLLNDKNEDFWQKTLSKNSSD